MKKKLLTTALIATMVLSMTACGGKEDTEPSSTPTTEQQIQEQTMTGSEEVKIDESEAVKDEEVGEKVQLAISLPGVTRGSDIVVHFPEGYAVEHAGNHTYGVGGPTIDEVRYAALVGQTMYDEETITSPDSALSVLEKALIRQLGDCHGYTCDNYDIEVSTTEMVNINGRDMCRYDGILTYTKHDYDAGTATEMKKVLVGYSTQAANEAYVCWVVVGFEEYADEVAVDAEAIANTFRDVE